MKYLRRSQLLLLAALWLALVLVSLGSRPLFPVDETRYAAVAWDMFSDNHWLVPHLNGEAYSHKPPLLFWMIALGWRATGVNGWLPRLLPALFIAGSLVLTWRLAGKLWPSERSTASLAPWILFGSLPAAYCCSALMFDSLVAFFTLLGITGIVTAASGRAPTGWALLALALGLGMLSKGPVVLLHTLPAALLAPCWLKPGRGTRWPHWYAGLCLSILGGTAIALAWALPAAAAGGDAYGRAILWDQTAYRIVNSFAHHQPWWWYLPWLLAVLFPWAVWPSLWKSLTGLLRGRLDPGSRLCLCWLLPSFILLSGISGKQPQYLLALLPAFALLAARAIGCDARAGKRLHRLPPALALSFLGLLFLALPLADAPAWLPPWSSAMPLWAGSALLLGGLLLFLAPLEGRLWEVRMLAGGTALLLIISNLGPVRLALPWHDVAGISGYIRDAQRQGRPVAHTGKYDGQYHFAGRLREPLQEIDPAGIEQWAADHPRGLVIVCSRDGMPPGAGTPEYSQPFRGQQVAAWSSRAIGKAHNEP
jgi:4-amino-4-deoxy-L-arabinose transferase-like glycosyltransferase